MNILFIMCDQLRWDYLSCYGHPTLQTPHLDALAARGVRFDRAYCQAPLCGPSRACFYTGRYMSSTGVHVNDDPYKPGEKLLGEYLAAAEMRTAVIGKSAVKPNHAALQRLSIDPESEVGRRLITGALDEVWRDDGLSPDPVNDPNSAYNTYLRNLGYDTVNPWDRNANGAVDDDGNHLSGWSVRYACHAANILEEHSETAYTTDRAIDFIQSADDAPWCLHLSYIKPHWPYVAPAPYHAMYTADDVMPAVRSEAERENPHPVYAAHMAAAHSRTFSRDAVRETVIPTYMGLVKQLDDHLGRLFAYMDENGLTEHTVIVFTSDHGDYLGDHWLGEKYLFHEPSVRLPLIIADPSPAADATRGTVCTHFVESVDIVPTFVDIAGGDLETERVEGRSLLPLLHNETPTDWRTHTVSEIDYSDHSARLALGLHPYDCRATMIRDERYKLVFHEKHRPQLFDMVKDPDELHNLGEAEALADVRQALTMELFAWLRRLRNRTETPTRVLFDMGPALDEQYGFYIGYWDIEDNTE